MVAFAQAKGKPSTATVTPRDVWDELRAAGATPVQAAGIMGNMIAESQLDPEAVNPKGAYGLVQWSTDAYPQASSLVTGHPAADLVEQVKYLAQTGGFKAASGSTPAQAASSFAAGYERCAGCQHGGAQNTTRQASAGTVAGWAAAGNWPSTTTKATDTAQLSTASSAQAAATCWWSLGALANPIPAWVPLIGGGSTSLCVMDKSQARGAEAVALMLGGALVMLAGVNLALYVAGAYDRLGTAGQRLATVAARVAPAA
jgi:Phage tail lysozyme